MAHFFAGFLYLLRQLWQSMLYLPQKTFIRRMQLRRKTEILLFLAPKRHNFASENLNNESINI